MPAAPGAAEPEQNLLVVGRLGRPHGLKGELTVAVRTDDAEGRFAPGAVFRTDPDVGELVLTASRRHQDRWVLRFDGIASREEAELLREVQLLVDAATDEPEDDAWLVADLVGLAALTGDGRRLGTVVSLDIGAAQDLLVVDTSSADPVPGAAPSARRVLVPFVSALVPVVDVAAGHVVLDPPGGLFDGDL